MARLRYFLPQETLDGWSEAGTVDIQDDKLVDLSDESRYPIREAIHFVRLESGEDENGLLRKVKSLDQVKALGAEHYLTSVIIGETVYEVVPGWIAEASSGSASASAPAPAKPATSKKFEPGNQEADLLAKLLLDKLS